VKAQFWVEGEPRPKGSPRVSGRGRGRKAYVAENPAEKAWERSVGWMARAEWKGDPLEGPVSLELHFYLPRRGKLTAAKKPDLDKLARAVLDALSGIVYRDDAQVVALGLRKRISPEGSGGVSIEVREASE